MNGFANDFMAVFFGVVCAFLILASIYLTTSSYGEVDLREVCRTHEGAASVEFPAPTAYVAFVTCRDGTIQSVR